MSDPQIDGAASRGAVAEQEPEFIRCETNTIWVGDKKLDYVNAFKLNKMAEELSARGKLGDLTAEAFLMLYLKHEFERETGEGDEKKSDPRLAIFMKELEKKFSGLKDYLPDLEKRFKNAHLTEEDLNVERYNAA